MRKLLLLTALMFASLAAGAQDVFNHLGVGVAVGTNGIGVYLATPVTQWLTLRAGAEFMPNVKISTTETATYNVAGTQGSADIDLDCGIGRTQGNIILNFYPVPKIGLYVAAGAYFGGNKLVKITGHSDALQGISDATIQVGDYNLPVDNNGNVHGGLKVKNVRPYVGIGWGRALPGRLLSFNVDLGVQIHGTPEVYTEAGDLTPILGEIDNDFTKVIDKVKVYPVLSLRLCGKIF